MKGVTDQKMVDYSIRIVDTADCIGHSKVCRRSSMTNFELFDV